MTIESNKNGLPKARLEKLTIAELSLVDRPCQEPATVALMKRAETSPPKVDIKKRGLLTSAEEGHSHLLDDGDGAGSGYTSCECMGEGNDATYHSHPWSRDDAGNIVIGMSAGHTHVPLDPANTDEAATEVAMRALGAATKSTRSAATPKLESKMKTDTEKLADLQKSHDRLSLIVKLAPALFAHFTSLQGDAQDEFLAKSATEREAIVADVTKRATEANEVVYTAVDGTVYRKRDDGRLVEMAKSLDTERAARSTVELTKRADSQLAFVKADDGSHVDLLRAVESIPDVAKRTAALKTLGILAANTRLGKAAPGFGGTEHPVEVTTAKAAFDGKLAEFAKSVGKSPSAATHAFLGTAEGAELYAATRPKVGA